ncbi:Excinuclease ATPase subunit A [Candidatus Phytoplasma australiense]|uniref:UvrABC system protein A n=1 Tax=Phytoplasma australiense TaxID=59748 RepID=B1VAR0_PHYAS|nr:Excinuclease ATPase subunit A [Candidatus Phytoplasma australiense]
MKNQEFIKVRGARQNNLKNINIDIPKNKFVVITGLSGSGKSSLAFDTLYQEGKRRYVESLSAYARQFLGGFEKPDVDSIEGLSPSISIDQKTTSHNPRSTVGTITEIYDYLRVVYANVSVPFHPSKNVALEKQTIEQMIQKINQSFPKGHTIVILAPIIEKQKGTHQKTFLKLFQDGFHRVMVNEKIYLIDEVPDLEQKKSHSIYVVVDRIEVNDVNQNRIFEALEQALNLTNSKVFVKSVDNLQNDSSQKLPFLKLNRNYHLEGVDVDIPTREPRLFSFNTPVGACLSCKGIGFQTEENGFLPLDKTLNELIIQIFQNVDPQDTFIYQKQILINLCNHYKIDMDTPLLDLKGKIIDSIFNGLSSKYTRHKTLDQEVFWHQGHVFEGLLGIFKIYRKNNQMDTNCFDCKGKRLNPGALLFKLNGKNIYELTNLSINDMLIFFENLVLGKEEAKIIRLALKEITHRLTFLKEIGLGYLTLTRNGATLSGGEAQRIRLATQIGSKLSGVLYVLDEPSIGLHQKDNDLLINSLKKMRDLGNSLIVVEHDHDTMLASDYLIDIGPKAGIQGGNLQAAGTPKEVMQNPNSLTGKYLSNKITINTPSVRRKGNGKKIWVKNASKNNLKNINTFFPMEQLVVVTGVSGSGKSTLVNDVLLSGLREKGLLKNKNSYQKNPNIVDDANCVTKIVEISQAAIGRIPRSNPVTYTGIFDEIRDLYTKTEEAKMRGYQKGRFSFNVKGGRCPVCTGDGVKKISMHFLPDVYVVCESCKGTRYHQETLSIKYKNKNIAQVLDLTVDEGVIFFQNHPKIKNQLEILQNVGLGYVKMGQPATTLSGGEAQRVKLASELHKKVIPGALYILDEPTTGLHSDDVRQLIKTLHHMVDQKATIVVIEHNLDVIKNADYIIDLGPEGGNQGGYIIAQGTPETISENKNSYTGKYLKKILAH